MARRLTLILCLVFGMIGKTIASDTLVMGTSDGPPYMIQESESGLDLDIPRAALKHIGYDVRFEFYPLSRALIELEQKRINLTAPFFLNPPEGIYVSDPHIIYRPTIISFRDDIPEINEWKDLANYRVATFQGAKGYFSSEFTEAVDAAPAYIENHDMGKLVNILMRHRTDVVVLDYWMFNYYLAKSSYADQREKLAFHSVIPEVPAGVAFNDEALRDEFNRGLKAIRENGVYEEILQRYQRFE